MTNSKYKIVVMLNMLQRLLREVHAGHGTDWESIFKRTFAEHAPRILAVTARADRHYAIGRLEGMLEEAELLDASLRTLLSQPLPFEQHQAA